MRDTVNPKNKKWEFDDEVASVFGDMLSRSIPNYDVMRQLCFMVGRNFMKNGESLTDIGCSNGLASEMFIETFPDSHFTLCDVSEPMLNECLKKYNDNVNVDVKYFDLRNGVPATNNAVVLSCLTLQFTPIEYRQNIILSVYDSLKKDGAFILVEKVLGNSAEIDTMFVNEYYGLKQKNGYTWELIQNKRKSLEGVLVPLTASFNEYLLNSVGFSKVDCFWRCLNFGGWIAIK